ncbi:phosphate ABC transporter ATP-binding protein [Desulfonatronovibrio hydrogenovorans]|uniref:phosphate ABC transporter ATP-binding protein n=1 Tax=Desulfonatronovibrio hydrogenovorans TaxID=53245 RepID=UPI00054CE48D|nr:ATP-binding cassette domain-containing protein [Desulfonatronovibrio hydrogenovorans]
MTQLTSPQVRTRDLSVSFNGNRALKKISLEIFPGRINVAVGPSGSGKTTFLRSLNRLNEFYPGCSTKGEITIQLREGRIECNSNTFPLSRLRQKVGMVFQHPSLLPFSIEKNLALPLKLTLGLNKMEVSERIESSLKEVGLWKEVKDRLNAGALELSGGQQQRLCLARVISLKPEVILLDEPSASLDFRSTAKIEEMILNLKNKYTVLAVTHSLSQMQRLADTVFVFKDGLVSSVIEEFDPHQSKECLDLIQSAF